MFKTQRPVSACKDFFILSKLGEGAFSTVFKARRESDNQIYALKKVKMESLTEKERENALNEVRFLASIQDPFIISYKEAFFEEETNSLCIVMEYADQGDLQHRIKECQTQKRLLPEKEIWKCLVHISRALQTLHSKQILHRDLKSANVFLTTDGFLKLGDLNVSKLASQGLVYTQTGTPYYASPEVWRDEPYDSKSDIWSLGCVLYEMCALKPPFQAPDMQQLFKKVQNGHIERIPQCYSFELFEIISKCLKVNPTERPMATQILKNQAVRIHSEEMEGFNLLQRDSRVNLLNKIEVPKNLANLKEKLPKPSYEKLWYEAESQDLESMRETKQKNRIFSADSRRNPEELIEKNSNLLNHLKIQKHEGKPLPNHIQMILKNKPRGLDPSVLNAIVKNHQKALKPSEQPINNGNICPSLNKNSPLKCSLIGKSPPMSYINNDNNLKLPNIPTPGMNNSKLPLLVRSPFLGNESIEKGKSSHLMVNPKHNPGIFQIGKPLDLLNKSPLALLKKPENGNSEKLIIRPNSHEAPRVIPNPFVNNRKMNMNNSPNSLLTKQIIDNSSKIIPSPFNLEKLTDIPKLPFKIVLKNNRPISSNSQRNDSQIIPKKEEMELLIGEEKELGRTKNKLRPFSCNVKPFDRESMSKQILALKKNQSNEKESLNVREILPSQNSQKNSFVQEPFQKSPGQLNLNLNNRALLYSQKPVSAPNNGMQLRPDFSRISINHEGKQIIRNLYSKQALESGPKSHFSLNINNNVDGNLLLNQKY